MELLKDIDALLTARTPQGVWQHYVDRLSSLGFSHVAYCGLRILDVHGDRMVDDGIFLSNYPPRLLQEIQSQGTFSNLPMYRWMSENRGSESWEWMQRRRRAGRLSLPEERMLDLFARHGHVSGYAIGLGDSVPQMRAGVILSGAIGMRRDELDVLWQRHRAVVTALAGLVHMRLSTLPYRSESLLTLRQREVLEYISVGRTIQEVAELLDLTPATVEKHLRLARKALGARTTAQAVLLATRRRQIFVYPAEGEAEAPEHGMIGESGGYLQTLRETLSGAIPDAPTPAGDA